jgi:hypothetical protein
LTNFKNALEEKKIDMETNNDWAKNVKSGHFYIDRAKSGCKLPLK